MILPWQQMQWQQLWRLNKEQCLPHALLLTGIKGTGKAIFAHNFCRALLCQQVSDDGVSCGNCHACRLIEGRAHPDVLWIEPEKPGAAIKIDQIRTISEFVNQSALEGKYRVIIINPAHQMNVNACNALLKTLEEPTPGAILILISEESERLPATILSRCQRVLFPRPDKITALHWLVPHLPETSLAPDLLLNLVNGAPLAALALLQDDMMVVRADLFRVLYSLNQKQTDPLKAAVQLQTVDSVPLLDFLLSWVMDLVRLQLEGGEEGILNKDYKNQLMELTQRTQLQKNVQFMEFLQQLRAQICAGINLNKQLMIENALIKWMEC